MLQGVTGTHLLWNCVILMMFHSIGSSFASPTQHVLEKSEVAPSKFKVKLKDASEALVNFFAPMTCRHKDKQALIPCRVGENINTTECLENKCCPSKTSHELKCYTPFKDNLQLTFRLFVLGAGGFFILGCLPFCCCACLRRSVSHQHLVALLSLLQQGMFWQCQLTIGQCGEDDSNSTKSCPLKENMAMNFRETCCILSP
ncbi:fragile X mental retardation 1 neighbor protein isoform X4 [Apteryx rowi]|uniref:fragile X mental retardation 1 neighbor protein isoform X4 n=1 Tax=Apteryx rowi TaxID=308060 RepID=UPI000E1E2806|nr:fragile X mental retardation 1 neighbor protein isoform X4 [Apteryx rowi]